MTIYPKDQARMRKLTMACWWPSSALGRSTTDWKSIATELIGIAGLAITRRDDLQEAIEALALAQIALLE